MITNLKNDIKTLRDADGHIVKALDALKDFSSAYNHADPMVELSSRLYEFRKVVLATIDHIEKLRYDMRHQFDGVDILLATIASKTKSVRVAVSKPDDICDTAHISEALAESLRRRLGADKLSDLETQEKFAIQVISKTGKTLAVIA